MSQISVGQALLHLMDKYQGDVAKFELLKSLYLNGVLPAQREELNLLLADPLLNEYIVSFDPHIIDNDPTRRYFETHLCFETLRDLLAAINLDELEQVNGFFYNQLLDKFGEKSHAIYSIRCVLDVKSPADTKKANLEKEISDALCRLDERKKQVVAEKFNSQNPKEFTLENIKKMEFLLHAAFFGIVYGNTLSDAALNQQKIDLYHPQHKGGVCKQNGIGTSMNYGILKGYMPAPADDIVRAESAFDYHKPSEQTTFQMQGKWSKLNFNLLVHPFSNGISSTIFNQLKAVKNFLQISKLPRQAKDKFKENLSSYFTGLIATLMFHSGGHTLQEFTAPFSLPEAINDYKKHFDIDTSSFSLSNLFYRNNEKAFMVALTDTIAYNKVIMNSAKVRQQVLMFNKSDLKSSLLERKPRVEKKTVNKRIKKMPK